MNKYEITIITREDQKDAPVKKEIEALGGKVLETNSIGQRKMIFPIKKETSGYYTVVRLEIEPGKILELNKKLSLSPEILRFLILTSEAAKTSTPKATKKEIVEPQVLPPAQAIEEEKPAKPTVEPKEEKKAEEEPAKPVTPVKPEKKAAKKPAEPSVTEEPKASPAAKEIADEEMSAEERLKALDKKLDELLKE